MADRPPLRLTQREFDEMLEYSGSLPTGTTPGKRWKRLDGIHDRDFRARGGKPVWMIGEYYEVDDPAKIGIRWYRPVIKGKPKMALLGAIVPVVEAAHA